MKKLRQQAKVLGKVKHRRTLQKEKSFKSQLQTRLTAKLEEKKNAT